MGTVQQNNFFFAGSISDNIRFARPGASDQDVRATLRALDCLDLLEGLPRGLDTQVGEKSAAPTRHCSRRAAPMPACTRSSSGDIEARSVKPLWLPT